MSIGSTVRGAFGRHERRVAEIYRGMFVDLDAFIASTRGRIERPERILEIGCGDGMVTDRLALAFPGAALTGIDICPQPGRLYAGDRSRTRFLHVTAQELAGTEDSRYQLVVIADVLHHVPHPEWPRFLSSAAALVSDGGTIVLKEVVREWTLAHVIFYLFDRHITGDRVRYASERTLRSVAESAFGAGSVRSEFRVRPWRCNLALIISPTNHPDMRHAAAA